MDGITPFLHRAEDYSAARPAYPQSLLGFLRERCGLEAGCRVADVGSGTGIFSAQLLRMGATVFAVEPNEAMRAQAEAALGEDPSFISLDAPAEDLPFDDSVLDLITCAQSFHWFDHQKVKEEFTRVLHGEGWVCAIWNSLDASKGGATALIREALTEAAERSGVEGHRKKADLVLTTFFAPRTRIQKSFKHMVELQLPQALALVRSRSYWPAPDSALAQEVESKLMEGLAKEAIRTMLPIQYTTDLTAGQMG